MYTMSAGQTNAKHARKILPCAEEKPAEGSEEKACLEPRMNEEDSLDPVADGRWQGLIDRPQRRDPRKVIGPVNVGMKIHDGERTALNRRKYPLLQVPPQRLLSPGPVQNSTLKNCKQDPNQFVSTRFKKI